MMPSQFRSRHVHHLLRQISNHHHPPQFRSPHVHYLLRQISNHHHPPQFGSHLHRDNNMATASVNTQLDGTPHYPDLPHPEDEWFKSLPRPGAFRPIQRFPQELHRNDEDKACYEPLAISIGPCHREKKHLQPMQKWKALYASKYIESKKSTFGHLYDKVERVAGEARKCYAEDATHDMSDLDFTRMMFLDGCFILIFLSGGGESTPFYITVRQDLLLHENQLPFIILKELEGPEKYDNLIENMLRFVKIVWNTPQPETQTHSSPSPEPIHLLHFLRAYLLGNPNENMSVIKRGDDKRWHTFRSVKELDKVGIVFRVSRSHRFSDVRFRTSKMWRGELELPPIFIDGRTKPILLNLMAYEMCCEEMLTETHNVTSYISFLDRLIDRPEDVMELRSKGILKNFTGSDQQVADLFNTITHRFTPNPEAYMDVKLQIEDQRKRRIRMWFVKWIVTHFKAPWSIVSAVAAAFALGLTSLQTLFSYWEFRRSGNSQNQCTCLSSSTA